MSVQVLTLFDLEPIPQPIPVEKKKRAAKEEKIKEEVSIEDTEAEKPSKKTKTTAPAKKIATLPTTEKNYYSIGETAAMFKVRTSHIRFWTVQFALKMRTNRKGDRLYTPENIEQLKVIHHLVKVQGFTIAGAKLKLKELKKVNIEDLHKNDILTTLKSIRATLALLRTQI